VEFFSHNYWINPEATAAELVAEIPDFMDSICLRRERELGLVRHETRLRHWDEVYTFLRLPKPTETSDFLDQDMRKVIALHPDGYECSIYDYEVLP
jgi:hypothetical protein